MSNVPLIMTKVRAARQVRLLARHGHGARGPWDQRAPLQRGRDPMEDFGRAALPRHGRPAPPPLSPRFLRALSVRAASARHLLQTQDQSLRPRWLHLFSR